MEKKTPCECPMAGFCERHKIEKNEVKHRLCATRIEYFNMWEKGTPKYPSLITQVSNLAKATVKHIGGGLKTDEVLREKRLAICKTCELYDAVQNRCTECGCYLQYKAAWPTENCPLDKWPKENDISRTENADLQ